MPWPNTVRLAENERSPEETNLWIEYLAARKPQQWVYWWSSEILESPDCVASAQSAVRWRVPWCWGWCCCCCCPCCSPLQATSEILHVIPVWALTVSVSVYHLPGLTLAVLLLVHCPAVLAVPRPRTVVVLRLQYFSEIRNTAGAHWDLSLLWGGSCHGDSRRWSCSSVFYHKYPSYHSYRYHRHLSLLVSFLLAMSQLRKGSATKLGIWLEGVGLSCWSWSTGLLQTGSGISKNNGAAILNWILGLLSHLHIVIKVNCSSYFIEQFLKHSWINLYLGKNNLHNTDT